MERRAAQEPWLPFISLERSNRDRRRVARDNPATVVASGDRGRTAASKSASSPDMSLAFRNNRDRPVVADPAPDKTACYRLQA